VVAVTRYDIREPGLQGIYRSTDGSASWTLVHQFPNLPVRAGQIVWEPGNPSLVIAAWGTSVAISIDAGVTFTDVFPWGITSGAAYHVALGLSGRLIYVLGNQPVSTVWNSRNIGTTWTASPPVPMVAGAPSAGALGNAPRVMVVPPQQPTVVYVVAQNGTLWVQDTGAATPTWTELPTPDLEDKEVDSGNNFLAIGGSVENPLLYYCAKSRLYVAAVPPGSPGDWHRLDEVHRVHLDLHGVFLSPDFDAFIDSSGYHVNTGTLWLLSDGGIYRSTDGGKSFASSSGLSTLATVNISGAAIEGQTALCLNTGDNSGFYSLDGGENWTTQEYWGGDNDCSFAEPMRPDRLLVFTPRRGDNHSVTFYVGMGGLPDGTGASGIRYIVEGPPRESRGNPIFGEAGSDNWNATSRHVLRGYRPIVASQWGEEGPDAGDYIFIRYKTDSTAVLLRTLRSDQIGSGDEFDTEAITSGDDVNVFQQGPVLPSADIDVVQASGGHSATVFYIGGDSSQRLWKWTKGMAGWQQLVPRAGFGGPSIVRRFFVDPYRPNIVFIVDSDHVKRSEDGGLTWVVDAGFEKELTNNGNLPVDLDTGGDYYFDTVLNDMQFDPQDAQTRFAVGAAGVFFTVDGAKWNRLMDATALPSRPVSCYYDFVSDPCVRALYVGLVPRGVVKISPLPWGSLQAPDPDAWTTNAVIPGKRSQSRPALAVFQGLIHMVRLDDSSNQLLWSVSADGVDWSDDEVIPDQMSKAAPALAVYNNVLHMVHLGNSSNELRWSMYDGISWKDSGGNPGDQAIGTQTSRATPALAVYNGVLHMVHLGSFTHEIWWSMYDGTSWRKYTGEPGDQKIQGQLSKSPPSLAVLGNKLHMVHIGDGSNSIWWSSFDGNVWWSNRRIRCQLSQESPALATQGGLLHMVHMGDESNSIWWSAYDGSEWTPNLFIPHQLSKVTPSLSPTPNGAGLLMVHLGDEADDVWESLYFS
jgi:hypothetical protein